MTTTNTDSASATKRSYISKNINLPLIGTRMSDLAYFEFIPMELRDSLFYISLPAWLLERERLRVGEEIHLHIDIDTGSGVRNSGTIAEAKNNKILNSEILSISLESYRRPSSGVLLSIPSMDPHLILEEGISLQNHACTLLREAMVLKKGVSIYLEHLVPLFSRIVAMDSTDFRELKGMVLTDLSVQTKASIDFLENFLQRTKKEIESGVPLSQVLSRNNFEGLLAHLKTPLPYELLGGALESKTASTYLTSIKNLEMRLFSLYNTLMVLFFGMQE